MMCEFHFWVNYPLAYLKMHLRQTYKTQNLPVCGHTGKLSYT